jgi:hypothetical protein
MSDQTLLFWGTVVTMFLLIAAVITARDIVERHLEERGYGEDEDASSEKSSIE